MFRLAQTVTRDWEGVGEEAEAFRVSPGSKAVERVFAAD